MIEEQADEDREYAVVLARLTYAAARPSASRMRSSTRLSGSTPSCQVMTPAMNATACCAMPTRWPSRSGYVEGGRAALSRLGLRALDAGETERARALLRQQLELGDEEEDDIAEVNAALALGDLLKKEGERAEAQGLCTAVPAVARSGSTTSMVSPRRWCARSRCCLAIRISRRSPPCSGRRPRPPGARSIWACKAASLSAWRRRCVATARFPEAVAQLEDGLAVSRQIGDLAMEAQCLSTLVEIEHARGRIAAAAGHERDLVTLEDRRGNRAGAGDWAIRMGTSLLDLDDAPAALEAFGRGLELAGRRRRRHARTTGPGRHRHGLCPGWTPLGESRTSAAGARSGPRGSRSTPRGALAGDPRSGACGGSISRRRRCERSTTRSPLHSGWRICRSKPGVLTQLGRMYAASGQSARARECYTHAYSLNRRLGQTSGTDRSAQSPLGPGGGDRADSSGDCLWRTGTAAVDFGQRSPDGSPAPHASGTAEHEPG